MNEDDDHQKKIKTNQISADPFSNRAVQRLERKKKRSLSGVYDIRDILTDQKKKVFLSRSNECNISSQIKPFGRMVQVGTILSSFSVKDSTYHLFPSVREEILFYPVSGNE